MEGKENIENENKNNNEIIFNNQNQNQNNNNILPIKETKNDNIIDRNNNENIEINKKMSLELNEENNQEKENITNNNNLNKKEIYNKRLPSIKESSCRSVNNYKIISEHIGEGTFGMVFKAEYIGDTNFAERNKIPKKVALKKIKMDDSKEGFPLTALREIMIMKKCHHENILEILEIVTSKIFSKNQKKEEVYLVFEYMDHDLSGLSLAKYKFNLPQIKYIMYQLLKGVQYLHKNNIIHRDIKCANILINNNGKVKLGDFGLARNITPNKTKKYTYKVVTLWFRAPELLLGDVHYTTAIDVWSCGCVFGELLTGSCPFQAKDETTLFEKICEKCGTPNDIEWPGVSKLPLFNKLLPKTKFSNSFKEFYKDHENIDDISLDLFYKMLQMNPEKRITIEEIFKHPFFNEHEPKMCTEKEMPKFDKEFHEFEYSMNYKKMKEMKQKEQNIAKKDYSLNKNNNLGKNNNLYNNRNNNGYNSYNKDKYLGKKHYMDK